MTVWEIVVLAIALAVDAFSVGAAVGLRHRKSRQIFRLSLHFGLFQALFPNWDDWRLTRGVSRVGLSTAVSIDAAAAGITLAITHAPIALSVTIIGVVAAAATAIARMGAHRFSDKLGRRAELVGDAVLILLGARTLIEHLGADSQG
jgi:putative Mn2+ efflux pump MntP